MKILSEFIMENCGRCGEEFTCENECGKKLNCGDHRCPDPCHQGPCYDCHKKVEQGMCFLPAFITGMADMVPVFRKRASENKG